MKVGSGTGTKRKRCLWLIALVGCFPLNACAAGAVSQTVSEAVDESLSAVGTARLAATMEASGQLTKAAAVTALDDALRELGTARKTVVELSPTVQADRDLRGTALAAMNDSASAMLATTESLSSNDGGPSLTETVARLETASAALSELKIRSGGP